jgi:hypothetical protein
MAGIFPVDKEIVKLKTKALESVYKNGFVNPEKGSRGNF